MFNPLSFLKSPSPRPESFIALDAGATPAKAYLFDLTEGPTLLGSGQAADGEIKEAVKAALNDTEAAAANVVAAVDGAHSWLKTTTIRHNRPDPQQPVDKKERAEIKEKILQTAEMQTAKEVFEFFGTDWDLELIDEELRHFKIDDQLTNDPLGQSGASLEASFFTAFADANYIEKISADLERAKLRLWGVSSRHLLTVKALAQKLGKGQSAFEALVFDVDDRLTEGLVVFGGGIWGNRLLAMGTQDFAATRESLDFWTAGIEEALADFEGVKTFPPQIFLVGREDRLRLARDALAAYPLRKSLPFAQVPRVEIVDVETERMQILAAEIGGKDEN